MVRIPMLLGMRPLHPQSIKEYHIISYSQPKAECERRDRLDLFRSRGTKHDGVFSADEHFILYAHAEAMKVLGELRIGWYVYALIK